MVNDGMASDTHSKKYFGTKGKKPRNSNPGLVSGTLWPAYDEEEMTHMKWKTSASQKVSWDSKTTRRWLFHES